MNLKEAPGASSEVPNNDTFDDFISAETTQKDPVMTETAISPHETKNESVDDC